MEEIDIFKMNDNEIPFFYACLWNGSHGILNPSFSIGIAKLKMEWRIRKNERQARAIQTSNKEESSESMFVLFQLYVRYLWRLVPVVITLSNGITISVRGSAHGSGTADVIATETGLIRKTIAKPPASVRKTMVNCSNFSLLSQLLPIFIFYYYFQHIFFHFLCLREPQIDSRICGAL